MSPETGLLCNFEEGLHPIGVDSDYTFEFERVCTRVWLACTRNSALLTSVEGLRSRYKVYSDQKHASRRAHTLKGVADLMSLMGM